jgi:L-2-hydroxycarboxylate dehydrogenase (NAD+)
MRADAIDCGDFAQGRSQSANVKAVIDDIRSHGNEASLLPGEPEARFAKLSEKHGGLLFTPAEIDAFGDVAKEADVKLDKASLKQVEV